MITIWGYELTELNSIPNMLTVEEFNKYTGSQYGSDEDRITAEIAAACASIRNFVGWHLAPSAACKLSANMLDRRVSYAGRDVLIQLPARYVTEVSSVKIGGVECEHVASDPNGIVRVFDAGTFERYASVEVIYTAGLSDEALAPVKELIAHRVTHSIAVPAGITSEASGGVSVTYNANWINNSRATALAGDNKELLIPYKVQGVF